MSQSSRGFTLIEVLIALMIIAIGMSALLKSIGFNIETTKRLKEKSIQHMVEMNAITLIQTSSIAISINQSITQATIMLGQKWYWRAKLTATTVPAMQQITVSISSRQTGPFTNPLIAFRYAP